MASSTCDLWASGVREFRDLQQAARDDLHSEVAPATLCTQPASAQELIHALPCVRCSQARPDLPRLADALLLRCQSGAEGCNGSDVEGTRAIAIPQQWHALSTSTHSAAVVPDLRVTGFAWMELTQIVAWHPNCRILRHQSSV